MYLVGRGLPRNEQLAAKLFASIPAQFGLIKLEVTADFVRGFPADGQYLSFETGWSFARTVCLNGKFDFTPDYILYRGDVRDNRSSPLLKWSTTLRDQRSENATSIELRRRVHPVVVHPPDLSPAADLLLDRQSFEFSEQHIEFPSFLVFPGKELAPDRPVFLHVSKANPNPGLFEWIGILRCVQYPSFSRFVGCFLPDKGLPGGIVTRPPSPSPLTDRLAILPALPKSLSSRLHDEWDPTQRYLVILGIATGMEHLHAMCISHNSLSPDTILVDDAGRPRIIGLDRAKIESAIAESTPVEQPQVIEKFLRGTGAKSDLSAFGRIVGAIVMSRGLPGSSPKEADPWPELIDNCSNASPTFLYSFAQIVSELRTGSGFRSLVDCSRVNLALAGSMRYSQSTPPTVSAPADPGSTPSGA
jgi:hypothetical protein